MRQYAVATEYQDKDRPLYKGVVGISITAVWTDAS